MEIEYASNTHNSLEIYIETDSIIYSCNYNSTITEEIACDATGMWETPTIKCPSCMYSFTLDILSTI